MSQESTYTARLTQALQLMTDDAIVWLHKDIKGEHGQDGCWCRPRAFTKDELRVHLHSIKPVKFDA